MDAHKHAGMHVHVNTHACVGGGTHRATPMPGTPSPVSLLTWWAPAPAFPGEGCGLNLSFARVLVSMSSGEWRISEFPLLFPLLNFRMF